MKTPKFPQLFLAIVLLSLPCLAQAELGGRVTKVIDGRTFVFETERGNISAMVQYIDVPEPQQPLSGIVHGHLERLIVGKTVRFAPNGFSPNALVGKVYVDRVDVGLQMVRDGAAWHVPAGQSGQNPDEALVYERHELLARNERRGIWSIKNLTPPWEFRVQGDRSFSDVQFRGARSAALKESRNYDLTKANIDMWVEVGGPAFEQVNSSGQLFWGYDPEKKLRNTSTRSIAQVFAKGKERIEAEVRVIYFQGEIRPRAESTAFVVCLLASSTKRIFAEDDELSLNVDSETVTAAKGQQFWREGPYGVQEMRQYRIGRTDLAKIASAKRVSIKVGQYSSGLAADLQTDIRELLELAN